MSTNSATGHGRTWQTGVFAAIALGLATMSWVAANGALNPHTRQVMTMALSFDMLVTLPGAYYLLIARPRGQRWWTVAGVALVGVMRAAMLVAPAGLARLIVGASIEAGLVGMLVIRARAAWRARGRHDDPMIVLGRVVPETTLPLASAIASSELAVFYYGLLSWWRRPHVPDGMRPFSVHQRGGVTAILYLVAAVLLLETAVVHIVVQHWFARAAWVVTAFDLYGALWIVAAARALVLRPILVGADTIVFRSSMWWTVAVDRTNVADVRPFTGPRLKRGSTHPLSLAWFTAPAAVVSFHQPVTVTGLWGRKKIVAAIAISIDDLDGFVRAIEMAR